MRPDNTSEQVSASPEQEDALLIEAVNLARQAKFSDARDVSESVLLANPTNATALQVNASECESRQEWGEAVRSPALSSPSLCSRWCPRLCLHHVYMCTYVPDRSRHGG